MILTISESLQQMGKVPMIIISIALILFLGFAMTRLTKLIKLPNCTAYIIVGLLLGPYCFKIIPEEITNGTDFISDIALAFITFSTGSFFRLADLKKNGLKVIIIALIETILSLAIMFVVTYLLLKLPLAFALILSVISASTTSTSTIMTIRQTKAKGDFVNTLMLLIAIDSIVVLLLYSVASSIAVATQNGSSDFLSLAKPVLFNLLTFVIGGIFGFLLKILMPQKRTTDNRLIICVATLFLFCGICVLLDVSPLLGCIAMGAVYSNITHEDDKLFKQVNYFSPPFLLIFFVRSGLNLNVGSLFSANSAINGIPLIVIILLYVVIRIIGKYSGTFVGALVTKREKRQRYYLGLALYPQASVSIGLATLASRAISDPLGSNLLNVVIAASVIFEIIGPICAKLSLYLSKSYSDNLEEITDVQELNNDGTKKSDVQILIDRIKNIQSALPVVDIVEEEEEAFTEASNEQFNNNFNHFRNNKWRRK